MKAQRRLRSTWQRWTIDEVDLGVVRLAVAEAQMPIESTVAEAEATRTSAKEIRKRVFNVEDAEPDLLWGDEEIAYVTVEELLPFLKRRNRIRGLPNNRPLREGDVFWIVRPQPEGEAAVRAMTVWDVAVKGDEEIQVWDVTAAARQVAKRTYDDAVRAASEEPVAQTTPAER